MKSRHRFAVAIGVFVLLGLALAGPAVARPRVDLLLLQKGDRVTCEIVALQGATLTVRTLAFGTVDVDWPDVVGLVSPQLFEVIRADGLRFFGRLGKSERAGVMSVVQGSEVAVEIPLREVAGLVQLGANLWASRRGHVDLGWNFTQADSHTSFSFDASLGFAGRWFRWVNQLSISVLDDANSERRRRDELQSRLEIPVGKRFLGIGYALHERNDELGLEARDTVGGIFGWLPVNSSRGRVLIGPGAIESRERYTSGTGSSTVTGGALLLNTQ